MEMFFNGVINYRKCLTNWITVHVVNTMCSKPLGHLHFTAFRSVISTIKIHIFFHPLPPLLINFRQSRKTRKHCSFMLYLISRYEQKAAKIKCRGGAAILK